MRLLCGNSRPQFCSAERTRSRASFTSTSARPDQREAGQAVGQMHLDRDRGRLQAHQRAALHQRQAHRRFPPHSGACAATGADSRPRSHQCGAISVLLRLSDCITRAASAHAWTRPSSLVTYGTRPCLGCWVQSFFIRRTQWNSRTPKKWFWPPWLCRAPPSPRPQPQRRPGAGLHAVVQRRRRHRLPLSRHLAESAWSRRCKAASTTRTRAASTSAPGPPRSSGSRTPAAHAKAVEIDLYGGYKGDAGDRSAYDVGVPAATWYAGNSQPGRLEPQHHRDLRRRHLRPRHAQVLARLTNLFGIADSKGSDYLDLSATFDLGNGWSASRRTSATRSVKNNSSATYTDYSLDAGQGLRQRPVSASLAWSARTPDALYVSPAAARTWARRGLVAGHQVQLLNPLIFQRRQP